MSNFEPADKITNPLKLARHGSFKLNEKADKKQNKADIFLYNTKFQGKQAFHSIEANKVGMYVCGPTTYDRIHIGNARPLIVFDILYRLLSLKYEQVTYVRNITDVDDKINIGAEKAKQTIFEFSQQMISLFHQDQAALNCLQPNFEPKATDHIKEIIQLIEQLIAKNYAYQIDDHVYFSIDEYDGYGKLSNLKLTDLQVGARVKVSEQKHNPHDFILWKPAGNWHGWHSPWSYGRPGWHIECSAMSGKYLGKQFDIHGGGIDLCFPHHENERAQSCCANGVEETANYWLHNGFLIFGNEKMSKSLGNMIKMDQFLQDYAPAVLRLIMATTHYRQPLNWQTSTAEVNKNIIQSWLQIFSKLEIKKLSIKQAKSLKCQLSDHDHLQKFLNDLSDDLNTPKALATFYSFLNKVKKQDPEQDPEQNTSALNLMLWLLGLDDLVTYSKITSHINDETVKKQNQQKTAEIIEILKQRLQAKNSKNYKLADAMRSQLAEAKITVQDIDSQTCLWRHEDQAKWQKIQLTEN